MKRKTTIQFVDECNIIHNNLYDYTPVVYTNTNTPVDIICNKHGKFKQTPKQHLRGSGCPKCIGRHKTTLEFIQECIVIHGTKYNYSLVDYKGIAHKITIICPVHGKFDQRPNDHLTGYGCISCGGHKKLTNNEFITNARKVHGDKYKYPEQYSGVLHKISIICPIHGEFTQTPNDHISGKCGCPKCSMIGFSKKSINWLNSIMKQEEIFIQHAGNIGEYKIPGTRYRADGYCQDTNTIYEFHGDRWHGNLNVFNPDDYCSHFDPELTAQELYNKTKQREQLILSMGYNLVVMWESDFNN